MLRLLAVGKWALVSLQASFFCFEVIPTWILFVSTRTLAPVVGTIGLAVLASVTLCFGLREHRSGIGSLGFVLLAVAILALLLSGSRGCVFAARPHHRFDRLLLHVEHQVLPIRLDLVVNQCQQEFVRLLRMFVR